jgi:hypothetical protein
MALAVLVAGGVPSAVAAELSCNPADRTDCSFARKRIFHCQTQGVFDNGACAARDDRLAAMRQQCSSLGYPYPAGYDWKTRPHDNYALISPHTSLPSFANESCPPGHKRYWKYSCCKVRVCGDVVTTAGGIAPDGKLTAEDLARLTAAINEASPDDRLTGQRKKAADVDGDRFLGGVDQDLMSSYLAGTVNPFPCRLEPRRRCETPCGDANGDGQGLDIADVQAALLWVNHLKLPSRCQFWASDINADGKLDQADADTITLAWQNGDLVPLPGCAP